MGERATRAEIARARREPGAGAARRCPKCKTDYPADFLVCPKDATPLRVANGDDDPLIGEVLAGSFMITSVLGEGGMGRVYEAEHVRLPRRFAIKVMLDQLTSRPDAVARFEREAQAVARIGNAHVVDVVDVLRVQGRPCMVTELLEGEELADVLDRVGKLPLAQALAICRQVCRGLAAAHAVGVVHRDLKPSNLFLIDRDIGVPFVKILDFGVAKMADGAQLTRTGMILGTPAYMAPEQARGATTVDERVDIYGVGAVLYHMLTGKPPFVDEEPAVLLTKVLTEDPRRPRDLDRRIPEGVESLIQQAMARDPAQRPAKIQDLERLLVTFDEVARGDGMGVVSSRPDRGAIAGADTLDVEPVPSAAEEATRRARRARPSALVWAVLFAACAGATVFVGSAMVLRLVTGRAKFTDDELTLVAVVSVVAAFFLLLGGTRVLFARWRSAPVIDRLQSGLKAALLWLVVPLGLVSTAVRGYALLGGPVPKEYAGAVDVGVLALPLFFAMVAFFVAVWRARRT
jgi:serine/threonine-protein kinase